MKLLNFRVGFASNSSSLHSTWHVSDLSAVQETIESLFDNNSEYDFICASEHDIHCYLAAQVRTSLSICSGHYFQPEVIDSFIQYLYPDVNDTDRYLTLYQYIDHQSSLSLPTEYGSNDDIFPSVKFLKDLEEYLINTKCIIIGADDGTNVDPVRFHIVSKEDRPVRDELIWRTINISSERPVGVKDGQVWKLFYRNSGTKIRFSFNDNVQYKKSTVPELVDVIITNQCEFNCPYCYRGCTSQGKYASVRSIRNILTLLFELNGVFEIILGGGDITLHPNILYICDYIQEIHRPKVVFNTTLNYKNFQNLDNNKTQILRAIFKTFKGIAISIKNADEIHAILRFLHESKLDSEISYKSQKITFQCIPELMDYQTLLELIESYTQHKFNRTIGLTFLGFKHTGRGSSDLYSPAADFDKNKEPFRKIIAYINNDRSYKYHPSYFGVDTELIKNFPELKENQADWAYTEEEGKFSCCIDLVDGQVNASSYSTEIGGQLLELKNSRSTTDGTKVFYLQTDRFLDIYKNF